MLPFVRVLTKAPNFVRNSSTKKYLLFQELIDSFGVIEMGLLLMCLQLDGTAFTWDWGGR